MDIDRLKALLRLASSRSRVLQERLETQSKVLRAKIIALESHAESFLRVQSLIRDDYLQEAYVMLDTFIQVRFDPVSGNTVGSIDEFG